MVTRGNPVRDLKFLCCVAAESFGQAVNAKPRVAASWSLSRSTSMTPPDHDAERDARARRMAIQIVAHLPEDRNGALRALHCAVGEREARHSAPSGSGFLDSIRPCTV